MTAVDFDPIDAFWAQFLGVSPEVLLRPGRHVVSHAALAGWSGAWVFLRGECCVVSAPPGATAALADRISEFAFDELHTEQTLVALFGEKIERTIGPTYLGTLAPEDFVPAADPRVRELTALDRKAVDALRQAVAAQEWDDADVSSERPGTFGFFQGGSLLAMASCSNWQGGAVGPGVLTHPDHRGRGRGRAVVSATAEHALAAERLIIYQTLLANRGAVAVADALGFRRYASHVAVRLAP